MSITIGTIETLVPEGQHDLVFRYLLVFSRFEYALKRSGYINGKPESPGPNWDGFSSKYKTDFIRPQPPALSSACNYFLSNPPRKQILNGGALSWSEPQVRTNEALLTWLITMVRCVRNNLFHGGKFPMIPIQEPARNTDLLNHSLTILDACLSLDANVFHHFSTNDG